MRRAAWLLSVPLLLGLNSPSSGAEEESCRPRDGTDRPSIGLVLGGGGARGSAHIGVIRVLEEMRVPVDCVVGTSIGALVGALYGTGASADELESIITGIDWDDVFSDETPRQERPYRRKTDDRLALFGPKIGLGENSSLITTGAVSGQKIWFEFETLTSARTQVTDFDELPIPFRAIAADLISGEAVVMGEGNLALAMRASMSVPGVFNPVPYDGRLLVDGGIVNNMPVDVARALGADIVIAVAVASDSLAQEEIRNVLSVITQLTNLMVVTNQDRQIDSLDDRDVLIEPLLGNKVTSASFTKSAIGIQIGYEAARALEDNLAPLSLDPEAYDAFRRAVVAPPPAPPTIDFVRLNNQSNFSDELILRQLHIEPGTVLDVKQLEADVRNIHGLGFLELVRYEIVEEYGQRGLVLHVVQDSRGSNFLEWGFDLFADNISNGFNLRLSYLKTDIDDLGSEFRIFGQAGVEDALLLELYKYIDRNAQWVVGPEIYANNRQITQFDEVGNALSVNDLQEWGGSLALGREISRLAAVSAGARAFSGSIETEIGVPGSVDEKYDGAEYFVDATYDRLDDLYIPGDGARFRLDYATSASDLGSDDDYEQVIGRGILAGTFGRHTLVGAFRADATVAGEAPIYNVYQVGGFYNLSGLHVNELRGPNAGVIAGSYQFGLRGAGLTPARFGFTVEYGGVADDAEDIFSDGLTHGSLFAAYRSPLGPGYVGVGFGENDRSRFFLNFGRVFDTGFRGR